MTSEKQLLANQQNAQLSTGPVTICGKAAVASNAIKHGIFTKDLLISSVAGREDQAEYEEVLNNLVSCLCPCNQMENLLIEKIAIDFWRLRRTIRFETGSISKQIETMLKSYYSYGQKDNMTLDKEIQYAREKIVWNTAYLGCIEKEEVTFNQPIWTNNDIESDISEDLYQIAKSLPNLTREERNRLYEGSLTFADLTSLVNKYGYSEAKKISAQLMEIYTKENQCLEAKVRELQMQKQLNIAADSLNSVLGMIPSDDNADKVLKYERSIQKSIFQNLFLLKKLQESF